MHARALLLLLLTTCTTAVFAAPATAFRVTLPETVIVEQHFNFTVEAIDGTGTVDPTYTGTVAFGAADSIPDHDLPPNYTFTAGDAGVHIFSAFPVSYDDDLRIVVVDSSNPSIIGSATTDAHYGPGATQTFVVNAPAPGAIGEPFTFTVTAAALDGTPTGDYTGTVTFDNTGLTNPPDYTFTLADNGSKTFTVTATRGGEVDILVRDIDYRGIAGGLNPIITCPGFTVTASNDGPICFNDQPLLIASTSETGVTFLWSGPTRWWSAQTGQVVSGMAGYPGTYEVFMSHPNGCLASATTDVALNSRHPKVQASGTANWTCDTFEQTFTLVDDDGPYTNIVWSLGINNSATIVSGQGTPAVTIRAEYNPMWAPSQWFNLYLSATNGEGCVFENANAGAQQVHQLPIGTIETVASACAGTRYIATPQVAPLAGVAFPGFTFDWSIENGTIAEINLPAGTMHYTVDGTADAVLTLTINSHWCSYTTTKTVSAGPSASIASAEHTICAGEEVQIPVTLSGQPPFTIGWSDGAQQSGVTGSFTRTVTPTDTTHYSIVSVTDANCTNVSATGSVEVTTRTSALITQQPRDTAVPRGQRATLTVDVEPDATAIQWYRGLPGDTSDPIDGANSLELLTPPITQTTTFWVEIETSCGTQMSNAATVKVESRRRAVRHP